MEKQDISRIKVGSHHVSVVGLNQALTETAEIFADKKFADKNFADKNFGDKNEEEIKAALLERLAKQNYIPNSAREDYGQAFFNAFRIFQGQSPEGEGGHEEIDVKVLGPGCFQCDELEKTVIEVLSEMNLAVPVDHVTDVKEIGKFGVMGTPALVIKGKVVCVGRNPPRNKIKDWLEKAFF